MAQDNVFPAESEKEPPMTTPDTTPKAVEKLAANFDIMAVSGLVPNDHCAAKTAATLRALAAERDALRADNDKLQGQLSYIADKMPDWIKAISEWDEGGEAALEEMQDVFESTDTLVSEVSGLTSLQKTVRELMDMHRDDLMTIAGLRADNDKLRGALHEARVYVPEHHGHVTRGIDAALDAKP
jgi:hypothetical protein